MKVLLLIDGINGVTYHRLAVPFMKMARDGQILMSLEVMKAVFLTEEEAKQYPKHFLTEKFSGDDAANLKLDGYMMDSIHTIPDDVLKEFDVAVFNRNISPTLKPEFVFQKLRKAGLKIVCDMDDSPKVDSKHVLNSAHRKMNMKACILSNMLHSDLIFHTTSTLKAEIITFLAVKGKKFQQAKNAIDLNDNQWERKVDYTEGLFGWMGSVTHYEDLRILHSGYSISEKPPLMLSGVTKGDRVWDKVIDMFGEDAQYEPPRKVYEYAELMMPYDVFLAPLRDSSFNRCKSELKMLEAAALGRPIIVSNVYPYKNLAKNKENCLVADNTPESWAKAINEMKNSKYLRDDTAARLMQDVDKAYNLDIENEKRLNALKSL